MLTCLLTLPFFNEQLLLFVVLKISWSDKVEIMNLSQYSAHIAQKNKTLFGDIIAFGKMSKQKRYILSKPIRRLAMR